MVFLVVIMRFGVVPSLLVPNAKMLFVLISCPLSRSESERFKLSWTEMLILSVSVVESCSVCGEAPAQSGSVLTPAPAGWWVRLACDLKNLMCSAPTTAVSCEMF